MGRGEKSAHWGLGGYLRWGNSIDRLQVDTSRASMNLREHFGAG